MQIIYTIGHSTRSKEEFLTILAGFSIKLLVDIRTVPRSRKNPQYNSEELKGWLGANSVEYVHLRDLGGLRRPRKDSVNAGWKNLSFRGYADYMGTEPFKQALDSLVSLASEKITAIMCAEAVPWRCHRSLVGDALLVRQIDVQDLMSVKIAKPHRLTPWAHVHGLQLTYPPQAADDRKDKPPTSGSASPDETQGRED
jgi:uncharacterized protein (DUF488 family)